MVRAGSSADGDHVLPSAAGEKYPCIAIRRQARRFRQWRFHLDLPRAAGFVIGAVTRSPLGLGRRSTSGGLPIIVERAIAPDRLVKAAVTA